MLGTKKKHDQSWVIQDRRDMMVLVVLSYLHFHSITQSDLEVTFVAGTPNVQKLLAGAKS